MRWSIRHRDIRRCRKVRGKDLGQNASARFALAEEDDVIVARNLRGSHYQEDRDDCEFHGNSPHPIRQYNAESIL